MFHVELDGCPGGRFQCRLTARQLATHGVLDEGIRLLGLRQHEPSVHHRRPRQSEGGVGKSTTAINLSAALAFQGQRVLIVDLDPQGNATSGLGINRGDLSASIYHVLLGDTTLEEVVEPTSVRDLFVAPATIDLAGRRSSWSRCSRAS